MSRSVPAFLGLAGPPTATAACRLAQRSGRAVASAPRQGMPLLIGAPGEGLFAGTHTIRRASYNCARGPRGVSQAAANPHPSASHRPRGEPR